MAFGTERVAAIYAKEILRVVNGSEIAENAVVDGTTVTANSDGRYIIQTGQVMVYIAGPGSKVKAAQDNPGTAYTAADIAGILQHTTEFYYPTESQKTDEPVAVFTKNCHFAAAQLTGFSVANQAAVKAALATCTFE